MLNRIVSFAGQYDMLSAGDTVVCAVSGGADSMALLWAMYLLRQKLQIHVKAAHFNHGLRGAESDRDEAFVREFCAGYGIELAVGRAQVVSGEKGLESAARNARYAFLEGLDGKIATAHTANDNAETVLMHMVRGTGLKGLGAIAPVRGNIIRPMLTITRQQVISFLREYNISYVDDSSNDTDLFLRNRLRHHIMPLLEQENPRLAENLSAMALRLRDDELLLSQTQTNLPDVATLRSLPNAQRARLLANFLQRCGVCEPEAQHIALAERLVFSDKPSAQANFPGDVVICRSYNTLQKKQNLQSFAPLKLNVGDSVVLDELGLKITCKPAQALCNNENCFTVSVVGEICVRPRKTGDRICLCGGSKSLKKLFIDRKIPAHQRSLIPVVTDECGILGVYRIGADQTRLAKDVAAVQICFEEIE